MGVHQAEHQIEVVDHQVEDDGDVRAARLERRDAGCFDIERSGDTGGDGAVLGRVAQQVAHLQHAAAGARQGRQLVGLVQRRGDGFFHQHVAAAFQRECCDVEMRFGGCGHDHRVGDVQKIGEADRRHATQFATDQGGALGIQIRKPHQGGAPAGGDLQRVEPAEMAGAYDADAKDVCHGRQHKAGKRWLARRGQGRARRLDQGGKAGRA